MYINVFLCLFAVQGLRLQNAAKEQAGLAQPQAHGGEALPVPEVPLRRNKHQIIVNRCIKDALKLIINV